ncbi:hypothetical protein ABGB14_21550 [Nonomuraea sp. B10E15]|uniref:hypothetical protein n=1 Tax=unclassified Nonomuraea TaxID=2593643 RepID=UPI00325DCFA6
MITKTSRLAVMLAATVMAGGAALATAPAAGATTSTATAATQCPFEVTKKTPRYKGSTGSKADGYFSKGAIVYVTSGSLTNGRLQVSPYWVDKDHVKGTGGACRG